MEQEINGLKEQRDKINAEVKEHIQKKKQIKSQLDSANKDINDLKAKRDTENADVKKFKQARSEIDKALKELGKNPILKQPRRADSTDERHTPISVLRDKLYKMDWFYQTELLSPAREKEFVKQMQAMEIEISSLKEEAEFKKQASDLFKNLKTPRVNQKQTHENVLKHAEQSEVYHQQIREKQDKKREIIKALKEIDKVISEKMKQADGLHKQIVALLNAKKKTRKDHDVKRKTERDKMAKQQELADEEKARQLLEAFKKGKKLKFDEFGLVQKYGLKE